MKIIVSIDYIAKLTTASGLLLVRRLLTHFFLLWIKIRAHGSNKILIFYILSNINIFLEIKMRLLSSQTVSMVGPVCLMRAHSQALDWIYDLQLFRTRV